MCSRGHKAQRHQTTSGVVHEHQESAGRTPILEPAVLAAVDLDQLAQVLTAMARLVEPLALGPRQPDPGLDHPGPAWIIQARSVSRETRRSWRSSSFSAASVGPKSE